MIAMEKQTNRAKQLTVAIAALALVLCICVVALPSEEVSAAGNIYEVAAEPSEGQYADIPSAIEAAEGADETTFTIKLMSDVTGKGFITDAGQNVTIDLNEFTYTINHCVGSSGTETNGMQLLADSVVVIKNGTITSTTDAMAWNSISSKYDALGAGILIQNYSKLTLDNVFVDGKNLATDVYSSVYALSNNNSNTVLKGETKIDAPEGHIAFDVCNFSSYTTDAVVTFDSDYIGTINGDVEMTYVNNTNDVGIKLIINEGANVDINGSIDSTQSKSVIDVKGTLTADDITNSGTVNVYGTLKADVTNEGNGSFNCTPDATINGKVDGETVNTQWQPLPLTDGVVIDASSSIVASSNQRVTVDGNVKVVAGGSITINGQLVINEGGTLTLEEGAEVIVQGQGTVIVNGDLVIDAGTNEFKTFTFNGYGMTVNGYVALNGADSFISTGKVTVNGTFEINDEASAILDDAVVAAGGEILVYGDVITSTGKNITNNGTITVDSENLSAGFSVLMGNAGVLDVVNAYGTITVTDADKNGLLLENVSGAYVTDSVVKDKDDKDVSTLYLSGTMTYAVDAQSTNDEAKITVSGGKVEVAENVILGTGVTLNVEGALTVSAEMTAVDGTIIGSAAGELTVTGKIVSKTEIDANVDAADGVDANTKDLKINASLYKETGTAYYVYTTLAAALDAGATSVDVLGKNTVSTDITVPVGTTVTMTDGSKLIISEEATMTVAADDRNSGRFDTSKAAEDAVEVDGTLVLENSAKSRAADKTKILSDTYKEVGDSITFTNIYNAVENAASGETVTVSRGTSEGIVLDKDLVIGQGVTLSIPGSEKVTVDNGVTVTVDGTIASEGTYVIEGAVKASEGVKAEPAGATIVNGVFKYDDASKTDTYSTQIVGAYFGYDGTNAIMPLTSVPAIVNDIESNTITLYGQMTVGDIDLSAYDGKGLTLVAQNDFTFGNITLGDVKFESPENKIEQVNVTSVTGAIVLANGTVTLDNVYGITAQNTTDSEDVTTSYVGGTVYAYDDPVTEKTLEAGSVSIDGTVTSNAKFYGKDATNGGVSVTVVEGATLKVASNGAADITVEGTMVIAGADVAFKSVVITGTVTVTDGIADATVSGTLYVGVSVEIVGEKKVITDLGVDAAVDGLTLSGTSAIAYVAPGATVGDSFEGLKSTAYYKDDALYVTAYVSDEAKDVNVSDITISIENAVFGGWLKEDGTPVDTTSGDEPEYGKVGAITKVYADIITEIYDVQITADGGIGTVAIDGVVLKKEGNTFSPNGLLAAGTYEIDYMLNSGFNGDNVKITVNGQEITGNTITLSGTPDAGKTSMVISISIYGTEPVAGSGQIVVNTGSDDMSLTDILLIVLVVLIVIMAVIVALRLMRS